MINKRFLKGIAPVLAVAILASNLQMSAFAADGAKYTVEDSGNGYNIVTQDGGATLTYSTSSGVELIEDDGYAFKDLNKNGKLDTYEDWRLSTEERAAALADLMVSDGREGIEQIAGLMLYSAHTTVTSPELEDSSTTATSTDATTTVDAIQKNNIRHILVTTIASPEIGAQWNNNEQAMCESLAYGIPANNSSDPRHEASKAQAAEYSIGNTGDISLWPASIGIAATFEPELVEEYGDILATEYRALGISTGLSPQIDLATEPRWSRISSTFGENSELASQMSAAFVSGYQTTEGSEDGWGANSINAMIKHWPSGGPEEGGRDAHYGYGKYAVYPGDNFAEQMKTFEAALHLDTVTGSASAVMPYYTISFDQDTKNGENVGNGFSEYILTDLLRGENNFDGVICTDWMITADAATDATFTGKCWGVEDKTVTERHYKAIMAGIDQFGGNNVIEPVMGAYDMMVEEQGQEFADKRFGESARRLLTNIFHCNLFEDPYLDPAETAATVGNAEYMEKGFDAQLKSVVMLKNKNNIISQYDESQEKKTVYVPEYTTVSRDWFTGETTEVTAPTVSADILAKYYNVTDNPEEADFAIVGMSSPDGGSGYSTEDLEAGGNGYVPISLQYREYTAENARETALANDPGCQFIDSTTGEFGYTDNAENRSYKGKSTTTANEDMLDMLEETKAAMGDKPVIVYMRGSKPMVWSEVEPLADAIVLGYSIQDQAAVDIIAGVTEPSGLLPMQQPANMDTVEEQKEDVPQDMECYVDEAGNSYDFAYGLNWSGVISDERTEEYAAK